MLKDQLTAMYEASKAGWYWSPRFIDQQQMADFIDLYFKLNVDKV